MFNLFKRGSTETSKTFGFKIAWLCVKVMPLDDLARRLQIQNRRETTWNKAVDEIYNTSRVLVAAGIDGWTVAAGLKLFGEGDKISVGLISDFVVGLSKSASTEVQSFASNRHSGYYHWIKASEGILVRCFAESAEVLVNVGVVTPLESWNIPLVNTYENELDDEDEEALLWADESRELVVLGMARQWSFDPAALTTDGLKSVQVIVGDIPSFPPR